MSIVAVATQKGGAGKTSIAVHVARGLQLSGSSVLLLDADSQRSATAWRGLQDTVDMPEVYTLRDGEDLRKRVRSLKASYDVIVIDGHPRLHGLLAETVHVADLLLIPVQPSGLDLHAAGEIVGLFKSARKQDRKKRAHFVVNRVVSRSRLADQIGDALRGFAVPALSSRLGDRVAFQNAVSQGLTVFEIDRGKARSEAKALTREVRGLLK